VKLSASEVGLVPPAVLTVISTVLADSPGDVVLMVVGEVTDTPVPATVPNLTVEPEVNPLPVMVTVVPPVVGPDVGLTALTVGVLSKVNVSAEEVVLVPPGVLTVMSTGPADSAGDVAVHDVVEEQLAPDEGVDPKLTVVAPAPVKKLVPVMVTDVPPPAGPIVGLTALTVGALS
jgi:hypothetical protein